MIAAAWAVLVLSSTVLVFARQVMSARHAAAAERSAVTAGWAARAALEWSRALIAESAGSPPPGDETLFRAVPIGGAFFWVLRTDPGDTGEPGYGLSDESAKINLNEADLEMLLKLPGMTDELAASLVDWRSPELTGTPGGAGDEHYLLLDPPYLCKRGPLETVEEILLVKGADPGTLFGDGYHGLPGFRDLVTVYSSEAGVPPEPGLVNVNNAAPGVLARFFEGPEIQRIVAERSRRPFRSIFDLHHRAGLEAAVFESVATRVGVGPQARNAGLVNAYTAPRAVLACLPGLDESDADALVARRQGVTDTRNLAWVAEALGPEKAAVAGEWLTSESWQFSAEILAVSADGRAFRRYRAVLDRRPDPPAVLDWQETTGLGWPLEPGIIDSLRRPGSPTGHENHALYQGAS